VESVRVCGFVGSWDCGSVVCGIVGGGLQPAGHSHCYPSTMEGGVFLGPRCVVFSCVVFSCVVFGTNSPGFI